MSKPCDNLVETIASYCAAWSACDHTERERLLRQVAAEDVRYVDPTVETKGVLELTAHIGAAIARHPGARIEVTSSLDIHHRFLRFAWRKVLADGTRLAESIDVCEVGPDGRLLQIIGFFGPLWR